MLRLQRLECVLALDCALCSLLVSLCSRFPYTYCSVCTKVARPTYIYMHSRRLIANFVYNLLLKRKTVYLNGLPIFSFLLLFMIPFLSRSYSFRFAFAHIAVAFCFCWDSFLFISRCAFRWSILHNIQRRHWHPFCFHNRAMRYLSIDRLKCNFKPNETKEKHIKSNVTQLWWLFKWDCHRWWMPFLLFLPFLHMRSSKSSLAKLAFHSSPVQKIVPIKFRYYGQCSSAIKKLYNSKLEIVLISWTHRHSLWLLDRIEERKKPIMWHYLPLRIFTSLLHCRNW